jgi:transcription-repair coupling factor (superfamily II helicase)
VISQANIYEYLLSTLNAKPSTLPKELILCRDDKEAEQIEAVVRLAGGNPYVLPDLRVTVGEDLRSYGEEIRQLLVELGRYYASGDTHAKHCLIAPVRTVRVPWPRREYFATHTIAFADTVDLGLLKDRLYRWGYHFGDLVAQQGEVSIRGDIIDLFPIDAQQPFRVSLFGDEVESIHRFDPSSQKRQGDEVESFTFAPAFLALDKEQYESLKFRCERSPYESFVKDIDALGLWHLEAFGEWALDRFGAVLAENMDAELEEIYDDGVSGTGVRPQMFNGVATEHLSSDPIVPRKAFVLPSVPLAKQWRDLEVADAAKLIEAHPDKTITIVARNESIVRGSMIALGEREIRFVYQEGIVNLINKTELILSLNKPIKRKKVKKASIILDELHIGDYVVHETHGVGIFRGIERREVLGATSEFVVLTYQGEDTLLIPVSSLETIDRYIAEGGAVPVLDRMGKASFKRLKEKVRDKLFAIASQIINLSAQRHLKKGIALASREQAVRSNFKEQGGGVFTDPEGNPLDVLAIEAEHRRFMASAGFEHTEDQLEAIETMLEELQSGRMMDRLLSADVGFGKTEVAMNAIFIAVKNGYQSMMIVPTTLLSAQHYKSLKERFYDFGITVGKLDRFTTPKEKRAVLSGLAEGSIDVVVGTHALLGAKFKHLALVVVDEEHKFGVKLKEALKEMAIDIHLLSMSATPIPRSLNLALSQLKSFSEILTPPLERVGVRTFVKNYDPKVIKEALTREIRRGGQVFYVYNSIAGIESKRDALLEILPKLRIAVLHSKISATQTEAEMLKFEDGEYDVLLSTSIVESGIHMPHANTMIVDGADRFGMADLHQLRGRVGRGGREGFCYFVVEDRDTLSEDATRRLLALETHSELGSGAVLAHHDLQIRGGGNIIGEAQSGHIKQIGYGLYLRMLEDAIRELSGQSKEVTAQVEMKLAIQAYLSDEVIAEDRLRLELYRRLSQCETPQEVYEIEAEIIDRFGALDTPTKQFISVMNLKVLAKKEGISKISSYNDNVSIEFAAEDTPRKTLKAKSRDDDDILEVALEFFR